MRKQKTNYTILIVCEGENTEPNYFQSIKEQILSENIWVETVAITISPKPKLDNTDLTRQPTPKHKTKRKKRQLRNVETPKTTIEKVYKAVPIRYVREAQQGLEDGTFDEVWAVFDKDGHPKHQEAFELATRKINGEIVNIAFSSISFEHWILLHFEKNKTAFGKSENAIQYLIDKKYLGNYSKKSSDNIYPIIKDKVQFAIKNAAWLKHQNQNNSLPIWEQNPYTNIDVLVKRLLQIDENYFWTNLNEVTEIQGVKIIFERNENQIILTIANENKTSYLLKSSQFSIIENDGFRFDFDNKIVVDFVEITLNIENLINVTLQFEVFQNHFVFLEI